MRKFHRIIITASLTVAAISGCNSTSEQPNRLSASPTNLSSSEPPQNALDQISVRNAIDAATKYKNVEYNVPSYDESLSEESIKKRNDEMKNYLTENFYKKAVDTRYTLLPLQAADKNHVSMKPENLNFIVKDQKNNSVDISYTVDLVLLDLSNKETNRVPIEGILTLSNIKGKWLVQGDRFDSAAFNKLINSK